MIQFFGYYDVIKNREFKASTKEALIQANQKINNKHLIMSNSRVPLPPTPVVKNLKILKDSKGKAVNPRKSDRTLHV